MVCSIGRCSKQVQRHVILHSVPSPWKSEPHSLDIGGSGTSKNQCHFPFQLTVGGQQSIKL